jgi:hypothetical protein
MKYRTIKAMISLLTQMICNADMLCPMYPIAENSKQYEVKFNAAVSFNYDHVICYVRA